MEIPAANLVNRYIATQGPLPHTCAQFWQVVWDQKLSLIVMLTTLTERGRVSGLISDSEVCMSHCALQNVNFRAGKGLNEMSPGPAPMWPINLLYRAADGYLQWLEAQHFSCPLPGLSKLRSDQTAPSIPAPDPL